MAYSLTHIVTPYKTKGTYFMRVIITYDLVENRLHESVHSTVKKAMKDLGYSDRFKANDPDDGNKEKTFYLPNTTLWHKDKTPKQAKSDLLAIAARHSGVVERLFADEFTDNWVAIPGKAYVP